VSERERAALIMGMPWTLRGCCTIEKKSSKKGVRIMLSLTGYGLGRPGLEYRQGREHVLSFKSSQTEMGPTQLLTQRVPGVELPENKTNNSLPPSSEVRTTGAIFHSPLYAFMACFGTTLGGRDSTGSVATRYGLDDLRFATR
jgi:hypothetical protein